jgi:hypothetical protein
MLTPGVVVTATAVALEPAWGSVNAKQPIHSPTAD